MVEPEELSALPPTVTAHVVPPGRPDSEKVTPYRNTIEYAAVAVLWDESVAVIVYEWVGPFTENVQPSKAPVDDVVHAVADEMVPPLLMENWMLESTVNPLPDAVTVAPVAPEVGSIDNEGIVTVKVPLAVAPPGSVATTEVPLVPVGTVNWQSNEPVAVVARDPLAQLVIATPSNTRDWSVASVENPVPATVTSDPAGPCSGLNAIAGVVTVKVPEATCPVDAVAATDGPLVPVGTRSWQLNCPAPSAVVEPLAQEEIVTPSKRSEASAVFTGKPVPATVTVDPTGPCPGVTVIAGVVPVNVAV